MPKNAKLDRAIKAITPANKLKGIEALLADTSKMTQYKEFVQMGASLGTLEAKLQLSRGSLSRWLEKGKTRPKSIYAQLYRFHCDAVADSRLLAESAMRDKSPEKWLEKNSSARVVEDTQVTQSNSVQVQQAVGMGQIVGALKVLRQQGYDINQIIDSGNMALLEGPKNEESLRD